MSTTVLTPSPVLDALLSDMEDAAADTIKRHSAAPGTLLADGVTALADGGVTQMMARAETAKTSAEAIQLALKAYPFAPGASTSGTAETQIRGFLRDIQITGVRDTTKVYSAAYFQRGVGGVWRFFIYKHAPGVTPVGTDSVLIGVTPGDPADPNQWVNVVLTAQNGSGLGGTALVQWGTLPTGVTLSGHSTMVLATEVWQAQGMPSGPLGIAAAQASAAAAQATANTAAALVADRATPFAFTAAGTSPANTATLKAFVQSLSITGTKASGGRYVFALAERTVGGQSRFYIYFNPTGTSTYTPVLAYVVSGDPGAITQTVTMTALSGSGLSATATVNWAALAMGQSLSSQLDMELGGGVWPSEAALLTGRVTTLEAAGTSLAPIEGRAFLYNWHERIEGLRAGSVAKLRVGLLGHSWIERITITNPLVAGLQRTHGNGGLGFTSFAAGYAITGFSVTSSGLVTSATAGKWLKREESGTQGQGADLHHVETSESGLYYEVTGQMTDAWLSFFAGAGSFRWRVDGGAWTTVNTSSVSVPTKIPVLAGGAAGSHTVRVESLGGGIVRLWGLEAQNGTVGALLYPLGNGSATTAQYVTPAATPWQQALALLPLDVVAICLTTNDALAAVPTATFKANLTTLVTRIRAALPSASVMFVADSAIGDSSAMADYALAERTLARDLGVAMCDLRAAMGTFAVANAAGFYPGGGDVDHLGTRGGAVAARVIQRALWLP